MRLKLATKTELENFMVTIYGAMLVRRAFDDPCRISTTVESVTVVAP
jgi:hypothetical protein